VGGVSGEPMGVHEEERSSHVLRSQRWKALRFATRSSAFAGGRYRAGLGRSGRVQRARSSVFVRTGDKECPLDARGGERCQRALSARTLPGSRPTSTFEFRGHVLRSIQRPAQRQSWGRPCSSLAIAVGQAHESGKEPAPGARRLDVTKCAAHRASPSRKRRARGVRKGRWSRSSSL